MNEEQLKELFDYIDRRLIICNTVKESINKDLDCAIKLSVAYEELQQENQQLKENIRYLQGLITNKIMVSEEYESILKDKFNELELKYIASTDSRNDLEEQLKQRDEVIDEAINYLKSLIIFWKKYNSIDNTMEVEQFNGVISILQKYKGDNNE